VLETKNPRFSPPAQLPEEIRAILQNQEMAGERLVNYVRSGFAVFSLSASLLGSAKEAPAANLVFRSMLYAWLGYSAVVWLLLRLRPRHYGWLKYLSITVDISFLYLAMVGSLYNHSGVYEVYRGPMAWVILAAFNIMAGLRYSVLAGLYSAGLVGACGAAFLTYVNATMPVPWVESAVYVGEGLNFEECASIVLFTALTGVFSAVTAWNSRKLILQAATESLARDRLEQDRDRLAKYFSKDVVDLVLNNPESIGLGGQRMHATVLFADIRNFTQLSTMMQPEEVVDLLNRYFSIMVDIVFKNGGTLDKFLGDGLMALFGVPYPLDRPEERAVRTSLEMLDALQTMNRELEAKGMLRLDIGVGINCGAVVAGNIGSSQRHEYTVIGDTVNLAARLEALNKETRTQILVSAPVHQAIQGAFRTRTLGPLRIRGKPEPIEVFAVLPSDVVPEPTRISLLPPSTSYP